jgi:hypothetical protein
VNSFLHSGGAGDIIYALPLVRHLGGGILHVKARNAFNTTCDVFKAVKRLLEHQSYVVSVLEHDSGYGLFEHDPRIRIDINLDLFRRADVWVRKLPLCYFDAAGIVPPTNWQPWLVAEPRTPPGTRRGFAIVNRTLRYRDPRLNWKTLLSEIVERHECVCFLGLPEEHAAFEAEVGTIAFLPTRDLLDAAHVIAAADALYCNQSACLSIAQGLGKAYHLEVAGGQSSCILGGPGERLLNR